MTSQEPSTVDSPTLPFIRKVDPKAPPFVKVIEAYPDNIVVRYYLQHLSWRVERLERSDREQRDEEIAYSLGFAHAAESDANAVDQQENLLATANGGYKIVSVFCSSTAFANLPLSWLSGQLATGHE